MKTYRLKRHSTEVPCPVCKTQEVDWDYEKTELRRGKVIETGFCEHCKIMLIVIYDNVLRMAKWEFVDGEFPTYKKEVYAPDAQEFTCPACKSTDLNAKPKELTDYQGAWGIWEQAKCNKCQKQILFYYNCITEIIIADQ